ncbi:N-acetyltransferase [Shouchella clausii]|uniref:GNAT family N-acetyltransferase n=1 Tax=Shouchella rhizosphaerae TaxID=866786 RepID=A0ABZ2CXN3_9BACI|nr:GNAT family N-acetyltransferase [Shouchella clausii]GIN06177.1 N-acetyltransferase [Shouchella clausii]
MIRLLTQDDKAHCLTFLKQQAAENLFIIGDIEAFGFETDFQRLWGEFDETGKLNAVLLKYYESYIPYGKEPFAAEAFANIMINDDSFKRMSGLKSVCEEVATYLPAYKQKRQMYYAKCTRVEYSEADIPVKLEKATPDDAEALQTFLDQIPEFADSLPTNVETKRQHLQTGFARAIYVKDQGKIVSSASTTAENSASAMIVGVATLKTHKQKGFASACVARLCSDLIAEGKEPCLFYDNPAAGAIYKRIGFSDIGLWMMYAY